MLFRIAVALLIVFSASDASAKLTYLDCPLPDANGVARAWKITLNDEAGSADVSIDDDNIGRQPAMFSPGDVSFEFMGMKIKVARTDLTISRTGPLGTHNSRCSIVKPVKPAF